MDDALFGSDLWKPALTKYGEVTGLTVQLFTVGGRVVLGPVHPTPLFDLFQEYGFEPGLFADCARQCLKQTTTRPAVAVAESHGMTVIGTSLVLADEIVGAAVAGYALAGFPQVPSIQRLSESAGVPFDRLWSLARRQAPVPARRLMLHGELLQVLGDALLRENYRARQYEETSVQLQAMAAAKDEFLAVLSHELRAPLTPILGWANILKLGAEQGQVKRAADAIERNALLQMRLVEDLLDVNRITHGKVTLDLKIHDLSELIRTALETTAQDTQNKAIRVEFVEANEPLFVEGDAGRLQQIFRNIFANAVKFTPKGGGIRVTVRRDANSAVVVAADTGVGIAPEFLPFVFEIFRQQEQGTRREHEGLGIGLALVKRLTELHNGSVTIASAGTGRGTEVVVRFPLAAEPSDVDTAGSLTESQSGLPFAGLSILVVEDSGDSQEALQILLEHLGAEVLVAGDGREALDIVRQGDPDLVVCDLRMPRMDGFEFIRELHRQPSSIDLPVVAVSGLASDADRERTREAGFEGHITKPFDEAAVVAAVRAVVSHRQQR